MITPVQELYEVWAADSELRDALAQSLDPRGPDGFFEAYVTHAAIDAAAGGLARGACQLLGKLCPTVYVWERRA